ncbi:hypothetical protein GOP47_0016934 [Adiantum capillus-veneris]|uniref:Flavanone 4-reductase n=1 Tax=Adiantum capillus-veneris TaxID=13818 RepID=A0A9D4ZB60_ADICA|nr:hypothetical protein GOP47_0016934 [Adiantum capillus-veneris]
MDGVSPPRPEQKRVYCVTGATGYLASWLVRSLLERGHRVRGTIRNRAKAAHLTCLPGVEERLELVEADLLDEASLFLAVQGCDGVFAVAIPISDPSKDQSAMVELAMTCTMNLLRACHDSGCVKRVVLTSTFYASIQVPHDGNAPLDVDETFWTSVDYCLEKKMSFWGYMVAKTMSERAAFQFAEEKGLDLVSILPSLVGGPFTTPSLPGSLSVYLSAMTADVPVPIVEYMSYVHVDDCVRAHILLMEDMRTKGRYLCSACDATFWEVHRETIPLLQTFELPPPKLDVSTIDVMAKAFYKLNTTKLRELGFTYQFDTFRKICEDMVPCLLEKGYLKQGK